jgi:hypothetical protein
MTRVVEPFDDRADARRALLAVRAAAAREQAVPAVGRAA